MHNTTKLALTIPIVLLLEVGALATSKVWGDEGGVGGCPWKYGPGSWDNGFNSGQQQAIYDHESNVAYNPYPESCQSDVYQNAFDEGYSPVDS